MVNIPLISKAKRDEITLQNLEEARQSGYDEAQDELERELVVQDPSTPKDTNEFWYKVSRPAKIEGSDMSKKVIHTMGTTFYPKKINFDEEVFIKLNRIIYQKIGLLEKMKERHDIFRKNLARQMAKVDVDSLSRRSVDGAFLQEVNSRRIHTDRNIKGNTVKDFVNRGGQNGI